MRGGETGYLQGEGQRIAYLIKKAGDKMEELDDFIRYVKEQFDCDIFVEKSDTPDTFERIFGVSFLEQQE